MSGAGHDSRVLRSATRRLALLTAGAVTVIVLLVGALVVAVVWREQAGEARGSLRRAVLDLDDLTGAPATIGIWVREPGGTVRRSRTAPEWLPVRAAIAAVSAADPRDERVVRRDGEDYRLLTVRDGQLLAQATTSTSPVTDERNRLLTGLLFAEAAGLALSLLLGTLLARRAMAPLATAMQRQRRFVADASHELRTPLTLLSTRAQLLERSLRRSVPEDVHAESAAIVSDARRLSEVVDDLLLSASLSQQPSRRDVVDLGAVARDAVAAATPHAVEQGVTLDADVVGHATVLGAVGPLRRVLDALLDNAVTHSQPGGHVVVRVAAGPPATVQVVDDGTGIDPEVAPRLFDRFAHGPPTGAKRHFGLGLALVREIVEAHEGTVDAGPTPGGGATFTVTIPRHQDAP